MFFPITTVVLFGCLAWTYSRDGRRSALTLALAVWAVAVLLPVVPIFSYQVDYSVVADAFVAGCLLVTTTGYFVVRTTPRAPPTTYGEKSREIRLSKLLAVFGIVGCLLLFIDAQAGGAQLSLSYFLENLNATRAAGFEDLERSQAGTPMAVVGGLLASCGFLGLIGAARFARGGGRSLVVLGVITFILIGSVSLLVYAGRTTLFLAVFVVLASFYISGRRILPRSPKIILLAVALIVGGWYVSVSFVETREQRFNPESILRSTQRAEYRPWIALVARGDRAVGVSLVSLGYFSSPLPTLSFYVHQKPLPGPFWGRYSFPLPARAAALGGVHTERWIDIRREVFGPLESANYFGNVYSTWLRDLLVDFGYLGAVLFSGCFGAFMAWARNSFERTGALRYHWLDVLACFTFGFGAFAGLLFFTLLSVAFFIALGINIWASVRSPGTQMPVSRTNASLGST